MNKKLLFGFMSLAALAACTNDDFESQNVVAEEKSPIQFEVINNNEVTRASMNGNKIKWSAADGDLFTLYHGGATGTTYENATYKAEMGDGGSAVLTTPSMIKVGKAIMVWPVDTAFRQTGAALQVRVPDVQTNIENYIPYVSDVINIGDYAPYSETATAPAIPTAYNTAGYARKYPIYMRPMASQLTIKADYAGTDAAFKELATGDDPINPIAVTSIELGNTEENEANAKVYTTNIGLSFTARAADSDAKKRWNKAEPNNAWSDEVGFDDENVTKVKTLTAKKECLLKDNQGCKFLILPESKGNAKSQVVVNTIYGKVVIGDGGSYGTDVTDAAWYRYISNSANATANEGTPVAVTSGEFAGKFKTPATIQGGLTQTFTAIDDNVAPNTDKYVAGEQMGGAVTRYVKVLLNHIDMDELHVTSDKQLYDAVRVWKELGLDKAGTHTITVYLDGDAKTGEFEISQKTIKAINDLNAAAAKEDQPRSFIVKPCKKAGEICNTIVITGGDEIQDLAFIKVNGAEGKADIALKAGENWKWAATTVKSTKAFKVANTDCGISKIINRGTLVSDASATIAIYNNAADPDPVNDILFENKGTWNINAGVLYVQFDVTNYGIVNIAKGAQYRQDGENNDFTNEATTLPERFFTEAQTKAKLKEQIGVVNNSGVFATVNGADINNYGLIEHADKDAKTYITTNQKTTEETPFAVAFNDQATDPLHNADNKMGRINLPYSNKDEDNISISATEANGFVSVTVTSDNAPANKKLDVSTVGNYVNYLIINSGVEQITNVSAQVKYIEFNDKDNTEIAWMPRFDEEGNPIDIDYSYTGLIVLSDVNIKLNTTVAVSGSVYIAADMYVGGVLRKVAAAELPEWNGYFGNTTANAATKYITY